MRPNKFETIFRERMRLYEAANTQQREEQDQQENNQMQGQAQGQAQGQVNGQATGQAQGQVGLINVQTGSSANTNQGQSQGQQTSQGQIQAQGTPQTSQGMQQHGQVQGTPQRAPQGGGNDPSAHLVQMAQQNPVAKATLLKFGQDNGLVGKDIDTSNFDKGAYDSLAKNSQQPQFMSAIQNAINQIQSTTQAR